jgi:hypothetical protein
MGWRPGTYREGAERSGKYEKEGMEEHELRRIFWLEASQGRWSSRDAGAAR